MEGEQQTLYRRWLEVAIQLTTILAEEEEQKQAQIRVGIPTTTDQGRPLLTGRDPSADRGRPFHDRIIEFDRGTLLEVFDLCC